MSVPLRPQNHPESAFYLLHTLSGYYDGSNGSKPLDLRLLDSKMSRSFPQKDLPRRIVVSLVDNKARV